MEFVLKIGEPSKRLNVRSFSSEGAEPEETYGNTLTGGPRQEVPKHEGDSLIRDDSGVFLKLESAGFSLTDKSTYDRYATTYWSLRQAGALVGKVSSSESNLSIALYRNHAAYAKAREVLLG